MPGVFITTSSSISPQFREYERFTTACLSAFIGPKMRGYVGRLEDALRDAGLRSELRVMASNGGVATPAMVSEKPVMTLLSGLAAGVLGGAWIGRLSGRSKLVTFDIGGTSADIGIVVEGRFAETDARSDIHTIGGAAARSPTSIMAAPSASDRAARAPCPVRPPMAAAERSPP